MKLLQEYNNIVISATKHEIANMKDGSCDLKKKSNNSLQMNPVASGDNVTTGLSAHRLKEELPPLVPCCEGRELQISEDLVRSGLSAISVKHDSALQCLSMSNCETLQVPPGIVKHRNSFRSLHRPDLKRVPYLRRMKPDELELLFRGYADLPARSLQENKESSQIIFPFAQSVTKAIKQENVDHDKGMPNFLHPIPETKSGAEDVPAGMRLHGTRARLYTSVLAGASTEQTEEIAVNDYDATVPEDLQDDEVPLNEELQIILPPRCDDVTAESSVTKTG
ncbi:uncharacterized protein LOC114242775 [Bombyx mandarina]|uniref:Uncharacterized protein LOC114242775 n=1 Tax=Bombyx mandarina TaxID=7092 RepID=A0A6J2JJU4_BOMMA|nr:uncharacterized protein LOC114242775 [Bombyx mandarina]